MDKIKLNKWNILIMVSAILIVALAFHFLVKKVVVNGSTVNGETASVVKYKLPFIKTLI